MATPWATFFPYIQPYLTRCPEIVIKLHLQEAAAEFCARSEVWRVDIEEDFVYADCSDYTVDIPNLSVLENVLPLYLDGSLLPQVTDRYFSTSPNTTTGTPLKFSIYQDTMLRFYPTPDATYAFQGSAVLKPALTATGVEDYIYQSHGRAIARGAIGRVAGIPNKEWSNDQLSVVSTALFHKAADDAKGRDLHRAPLRVAMRSW